MGLKTQSGRVGESRRCDNESTSVPGDVRHCTVDVHVGLLNTNG